MILTFYLCFFSSIYLRCCTILISNYDLHRRNNPDRAPIQSVDWPTTHRPLIPYGIPG